MNRALPAALLLALLIASPLANVSAQEAEAPAFKVLATDVGADTGLVIAETDVAPRQQDSIDLRSLEFEESEADKSFIFTLITEGARDSSAPDSGLWFDEFWIYFSWDDREFALVIERFENVLDGEVFSYCSAREYDSTYDYWFYYFFTSCEWEEQTVDVAIPKAVLLDSDGAQPQEGDIIEGFWVESKTTAISLGGIVEPTISDRMPDEGISAETWEVLFGPPIVGHGMLLSDRPFRASNGEATTFFYELTALNTAQYTDTFRFAVRDAPDNWVVTFPHKELRISGEEDETFPVLITVPFAHQHGSVESLWIDMTSNSDPLALASLELGVRYLDVPQPAGHHDTLYMHSDSFWPFMNTVQDYEFDTGSPIDACCTSSSFTESSFSWYVPLQPNLQMGLDFDLERTGTISVPFSTQLPLEQVSFRGVLTVVVCRFDTDFGRCDDVEVARVEPTAPVDMGPQSSHTFEAVITPLEGGDYVDILDADYQYMELYMTLDTESPYVVGAEIEDVSTKPFLQPGGVIQLPLNEFHDDVSEFFRAVSGIELVAKGAQQKLVNPGESALFVVDAFNEGALAATFDISVTGANQQWVNVLGDKRIKLGAGETRQLAISVTPPTTASDGDLVDVVLQATKSDDPNVRSLIRLLAEVDTEADHPDESGEAKDVDSQLRSTPAVPLLVVIAGIAAIRRLNHST